MKNKKKKLNRMTVKELQVEREHCLRTMLSVYPQRVRDIDEELDSRIRREDCGFGGAHK